MREVLTPAGHLDQLPKRGHRERVRIALASDEIGEAGVHRRGMDTRQLVDEGQFVATVAPLAHDPQVQGLVSDQTVGPIDDKVNYDQITGDVIDGIAGWGSRPVLSAR